MVYHVEVAERREVGGLPVGAQGAAETDWAWDDGTDQQLVVALR